MTHISSIDRPTQLRSRADLVATAVENTSGVVTWVVKDPLTLELFQFSAEEYALVDWLREDVSIGELQRLYQRKFSPQTITPQAIWEFMSRLHAAGLLVSDSVGQGQELLERRDRERMRKFAFSWTGLLGIRFRGIDPDRFLTAALRYLRWLFSPLTLVFAAAVMLYALSLVFGHFGEFRTRLPEISALVDWRNLPYLLLAMGGVKVLHELGHALTCKHFGGEVHEAGFMLLVFAPALYCDVSDAWRFPNKWRRIAVSAAGVIVELFLGAVATIAWWYALPGVVQLVALNVMIICTVNTLAINGNPLMRYDGYFILSDFMETPNLWQRSREAFNYFWSEWLLGQPASDDPLLPPHERPWLAIYATISKCYMTIVCVTIVWSLAKTLAPLRLENLAYLVGLTILGGALVGPVKNATEFVNNPMRRGQAKKGRLAIVAGVAAAVLIGILAFPVNYNISAPFVLLPADAARIYATSEGTLVSMLPAGTNVERGQTIGKLTNSETELEIARLEGECQLRQLRVGHLERLRGLDHEANDKLPTARTALADSQRRLEERRMEAARLTLRAPADGVLIPAPRVPDRKSTDGRLTKWTGSLLDPVSHGAFVEPGTLACLVGDPSKLTAVLLVSDVDVKFLQPGEPARLKIEQLPGQVLEGKVVEISRHEMNDSEQNRPARADLTPLTAGMIPPGHEGPRYEVRVELDRESLPPLVIGGRGDAKVVTERVTLARRLWRAFAQTFRLPT